MNSIDPIIMDSASDHLLILYLIRPILASSFVFFLLFLGWFLAWKLVLAHVPLVLEIFSLRNKTFTPKPPSRARYSRFYNNLSPPISAATDQSTLLDFKSQITTVNGFSDIISSNWTSTTPVCSWVGVSCCSSSSSGSSSRVSSLNLSNMGLTGAIPPYLGNLTSLTSFDISNNNFYGSIPDSIYNMSSLQLINISANAISDSLPAGICDNLPRLRILSLASNKLFGEIPSSLKHCRQLQYLSLSDNQINGSIPEEIGELSLIHQLYLGDNNLGGSIPSKIGNLRRLETLSIPDCSLTGSITPFIFNMSSLKVIDLTNNSLSGSLPMDMCRSNHSVPESLHLSYNKLTGNISSNIWECRGLRSLAMSDNNFTGSIPTKVGNLTFLNYLDLAGNGLTGGLPSEIANLNLELLSLSDNYLTGRVPNGIFNSSSMQFLGLANNLFSGQLPSLWLPNLDTLYIGFNRFSGLFPSSISNSSKLTLLQVTRNSFSGSIPNTLGNLRDMKFLYLGENNFTRESFTPELRFLSSLTNCRQLVHLGIALNQFKGFLPSSIGNLSTSLDDFEAFGSQITGPIPSEIGNLSSLSLISLDSNELTGSIPSTLGKLGQLQRLYLEHNRLEGTIPNSLCQLQNLGEIFVSDNRLSGHIPACLGEIKSMRNLYLDSNNFTSTIPPTLWGLEDLLMLNLSTNYLTGSLPSDIQKLRVITKLDLSYNQLSGDIPSTIGSFQMLSSLSLAHNIFEGPIPQLMGNLISLVSLNLSHNNMTGVIPKSLEALRYLHLFDVSYNRLEGEVPTGGQFVNFTAQSFSQNGALCGAPRLKIPQCESVSFPRSRSRSRNIILRYTLPPIASAIFVLALVFGLLKYMRRNMRPQTVTDTFQGDRKRVLYDELFKATDGFNVSNLIGMGSVGSVYKGTFSDGKIAAVKVFSLQIEGAYKSFDGECEIMRNVRHRNLTKIINSYSNSEFRALVLEYMPNGSLEDWLYTDFFHLSFLQRVNIMIDIAAALEYLHYGCTTLIVHCDLKPSNVLLDQDMVAHVSDFGISKLLGEHQFIAQTKTLGTIGYMAPEYGTSGIVSARGDVYSYGIMLMEVLTRKKPTDEIFSGEMSLKMWVKKALSGPLNEVMDMELVQDYKDYSVYEKYVSSMLHLAVECSSDSPEKRINIKQVVARLQKIKTSFLESKCE